jgi:hypothetical protein
VAPRAGTDAVEKKKTSYPAGHQTPAVRPAATPTELSRLRLYNNVTGDRTHANFSDTRHPNAIH